MIRNQEFDKGDKVKVWVYQDLALFGAVEDVRETRLAGWEYFIRFPNGRAFWKPSFVMEKQSESNADS